jgi:co-chaperonin GroES (HSP10)
MIKGKLTPLHDDVLVYGMHFGETKTKGGIIMSADDAKAHGVKSRWAKVYDKGSENKDDYQKNDCILIEHGRWTRKIKVDDPDLGEVEIQKVEKSAILAVGTDDFEPELAYWGQHYSDGDTATFDAGDFGAQ